jgi:16S rRNA C967 or C1407 C5-methylase (RsmB/RsmF family)/NOL1/NOP2/fmu family ribosome biogenesis protein
MTEDHFPQAFKKSVQMQLGNEWDEFAEAHRKASPISIRNNPNKATVKDQGPSIPWTKQGRYLKERPSFTLDPSFHGGSYYVQEASSMFLEQAFSQVVVDDGSINILDLCAAPGGKSTHLLSLMNKNSLLVSNEVIQSRGAILSENIQKWGHNNVVVTNNDPGDFQRLPGFFDVVVVDAPCSGEGLFRKDPTAVREWSEDHVILCSRRQKRILSDVWPSLKSGGILIYSTCTYNEFENEENLKWLQSEHDVEFISLKIANDWGVVEIRKDSVTGYRFFPHKVSGEGFFISVLRKKEEADNIKIGVKNILTEAPKKIVGELSQWLLNPEEKTFLIRNDTVQFFPESKRYEIETVVKNLRVIIAGTYLATAKHNKLVPEHGAAMSIDLNKDFFESIPLTHNEALLYLKKESFFPSGNKKGFALAAYENLPLGWVNVLENRMNNLYPSEWRIRMR